MDKFGIFNLLNSLATLNNKTGTSIKDTQSDSPSFVQSLMSALSNNVAQPSTQPKQAQTEQSRSPQERASQPPLQYAMLSTMRSHDEFIKRVNSKEGKRPN